MLSMEQEELRSEWNGQFDSVQERYASSALDPIYESYCDYSNQMEDAGETPMPWVQFEHMEKCIMRAARSNDREQISLWQTCPPERLKI